MAVRPAPRLRYRVLLWLDEAHQPEQWAIATYRGDDKTTETTRACGPFDSAHETLDMALHAVDRQLKLL